MHFKEFPMRETMKMKTHPSSTQCWHKRWKEAQAIIAPLHERSSFCTRRLEASTVQPPTAAKSLSKLSADARLPDKHTPSWGLSHFYLNFAPLQTGPAKQVPEKPPQVVTRHDFTHRAAQSVAGRPKRQTPTPSGETAGR